MSDIKNRDTDYHNRLEREVTSLRQDNVSLKRDIHELRLQNQQLRQAIAVLNDEPTNSL